MLLTRSLIRFAVSVLVLLFVNAAVAVTPAAATGKTFASADSHDLQAFQLVAAGSGWVLIGQSLYWTDSGGKEWRSVPLPELGGATIGAAAFVDSQAGWLVLASPRTSTAGQNLSLLRTVDGGRTWQPRPLDLFMPGDVSALAGSVFLNFVDAQTGWLVVKQATSSLFSMGTLFKTTDGGGAWSQLAIPAGGPVNFSNAQEGSLEAGPPGNERYVTHDGGQGWAMASRTTDGPGAAGLSDMSMATPESGWAKSLSGACEGQSCELLTQLLETSDGGKTWSAVPLPGGGQSLQRTFAAPAGPESAQATNGLSLSFDGAGFDTCIIGSLPSTGDMQKWFTSSPYRVRNLYLGGSSLPNCGNLTASYVQQLAQQGWLFIPTWVGLQPPCSGIPRKMSSDPATAYNEGVIEAYLALNAAAKLGFTLAGQSGTVIYYDVENFTVPPNDQSCQAAAKSFISGWTATLHAKGNLAGVYGSPFGSHITDFATIPNVPDMVWIAAWFQQPHGYDPAASVWNLNGIDNSLWANNQRLRQYTGGHSETYDGASFNIDSDNVAGSVATVAGNCIPAATQVALFVYPQFGGQCVVKNVGGYPTVASLTLPNDTISSVRVGANARLTICRDEFNGGGCEDLSADTPNLIGHAVGDNAISSATVVTVTQNLANRIYFPIVGVSPVITIPLPNGGFEGGSSGWNTSSSHGQPLIVSTATPVPAGATPRSGSWMAWLGGVFTETAELQQSVAVPAYGSYLSYWQWIDSGESGCSYDYVSVWANNTVLTSYGLCGSSHTNGWSRHSIDVGAYAGSLVTLKFQVKTDASIQSSLFIDDVVFSSAP